MRRSMTCVATVFAKSHYRQNSFTTAEIASLSDAMNGALR